MERIAKQVLNVRGRKGCAAALSREYQRNWSNRAWQVAIAKGNYDLGRQHLNFQISKGGKIAPIDKSKSIPQLMAENLAARGIKDKMRDWLSHVSERWRTSFQRFAMEDA